MEALDLPAFFVTGLPLRLDARVTRARGGDGVLVLTAVWIASLGSLGFLGSLVSFWGLMMVLPRESLNPGAGVLVLGLTLTSVSTVGSGSGSGSAAFRLGLANSAASPSTSFSGRPDETVWGSARRVPRALCWDAGAAVDCDIGGSVGSGAGSGTASFSWVSGTASSWEKHSVGASVSASAAAAMIARGDRSGDIDGVLDCVAGTLSEARCVGDGPGDTSNSERSGLGPGLSTKGSKLALARDTIAGWTTALGKFAGSGSLLGFRSESRDLSVAGRDPGWRSFSPRVLIVGTARLSAASGDFPASLIVNPESFEHAGRDVPVPPAPLNTDGWDAAAVASARFTLGTSAAENSTLIHSSSRESTP